MDWFTGNVSSDDGNTVFRNVTFVVAGDRMECITIY